MFKVLENYQILILDRTPDPHNLNNLMHLNNKGRHAFFWREPFKHCLLRGGGNPPIPPTGIVFEPFPNCMNVRTLLNSWREVFWFTSTSLRLIDKTYSWYFVGLLEHNFLSFAHTMITHFETSNKWFPLTEWSSLWSSSLSSSWPWWSWESLFHPIGRCSSPSRPWGEICLTLITCCRHYQYWCCRSWSSSWWSWWSWCWCL